MFLYVLLVRSLANHISILFIAKCDDIRQSIYKQNGGKFIWTFLKPLFVGKILFTPDTEVTRNITRAANTTFNELAKIVDTVKVIVGMQHTFDNGFSDPNTLNHLKVRYFTFCVRCMLF